MRFAGANHSLSMPSAASVLLNVFELAERSLSARRRPAGRDWHRLASGPHPCPADTGGGFILNRSAHHFRLGAAQKHSQNGPGRGSLAEAASRERGERVGRHRSITMSFGPPRSPPPRPIVSLGHSSALLRLSRSNAPPAADGLIPI